MNNKRIIFYDGDCVLCNGLCAFLLRRLDQHPFYFAMLYHSRTFKNMPIRLEKGIDSVVFLDGNMVYTHSDAVIEIFKHMDGPWKVIAVIGFVPKVIRDFIYRIIARYRKSFLGTARTCELYSKQQRQRILH